MKYLSIILIVSFAYLILLVFKKPVRRWLQKLSARLKIRSLRVAINAADEDKSRTNRKNIVFFNSSTGEFETIQKKKLKGISKQRTQASVPNGYRQQPSKKKSVLNIDKIKEVEKKSLYKTN